MKIKIKQKDERRNATGLLILNPTSYVYAEIPSHINRSKSHVSHLTSHIW